MNGILKFENKRVVVTGGTSGIGREVVKLLASEGARVALLDRDVDVVPPNVANYRVDLSDSAATEDVFKRAIDDLGGIDILCNNAGIGSTRNIVDVSLDEWERVFAVNVRAVYQGTRLAIPKMLEQGGGSIVNTASAAGLIGLPDRAAYCASKGAVIALTRQVAVQYAKFGIRCNSVCPGTVDSPWVGRLLAESPDADKMRQQLIDRQPMGRLATPKEIAVAIAFLAGPDAAFITGTELVVDGGILAS